MACPSLDLPMARLGARACFCQLTLKVPGRRESVETISFAAVAPPPRPQAIAKRGHYGAFLLDEPDLIVSIVEQLTRSVSTPVMVKMRVVKPRAEGQACVGVACEGEGQAGARACGGDGDCDAKGVSCAEAANLFVGRSSSSATLAATASDEVAAATPSETGCASSQILATMAADVSDTAAALAATAAGPSDEVAAAALSEDGRSLTAVALPAAAAEAFDATAKLAAAAMAASDVPASMTPEGGHLSSETLAATAADVSDVATVLAADEDARFYESTMLLALRLQAAGAAVLTLHGRTKEQKTKVECDWKAIAALKRVSMRREGC